MRKLPLLAMACALAGCAREGDWQVVSVETFPEQATEHLEGTQGCHALRVRGVPAIRHFRNGETERYEIDTLIAPVEICK